MFFRTVKLAAVMAVGLGVSSASAASFFYDLFNHPDGSESPPFDYGIRLDEASEDGRFFSFEGENDNGDVAGVQLAIDEALGWVRITGTVLESLGEGPMGESLFGDAFQLTYQMFNVNLLAPGTGFFSETAGTGSGTLTSASETLMLGSQLATEGPDAGTYFVFNGDGHRLFEDNETPVGRGWVNVDSTDCCNDFLFVGEFNRGSEGTIPLPAAAWMLLSGVAGLGVVARRRRQKS